MKTFARDLSAVLARCIALVEDQRLPLREAAKQTQAEYNRYTSTSSAVWPARRAAR